jgi:vitamin B12/bleomycin/antimicrobial peptide transport system ATP-binding/permease protein
MMLMRLSCFRVSWFYRIQLLFFLLRNKELDAFQVTPFHCSPRRHEPFQIKDHLRIIQRNAEDENGKVSSPATLFLSMNINGDDDSDTKESQIEWDTIVHQSKRFYEMAFPYYKESIQGRWLFAGMIGMTLVNSAVSVAFSYLGKDFWNALNAKDPEQFYFMLSKFGVALVVGAPVVVLYRFQRERLAVHWREWMTERTLDLYSSHQVYYALERNSNIDNPDQRIAEDVRSFTAFSLQLFLTILTSIIDLFSFSAILYSIQPQLFGAIVVYATFGTIVTTTIGSPLVKLNYLKLQKEADFRYALVRLRENAESIAFYGGEDLEGKGISERLKQVLSNQRERIGATRNLEFFTTAYQYLIQIVPVAVVAPQYFAGAVQLGVVSQSAGAFNHILGDLSILVNQFESLSAFSAGIDRLAQFYEEMRSIDLDRSPDMPLLQPTKQTSENAQFSQIENSIHLSQSAPASSSKGIMNQPILSIQNLHLLTPDRKRSLIEDLTLNIFEGQSLLIIGSSGAGKSSLLRAIAGLWSAGSGSINRPADEDVYFLPQRPYCTLGSLRDQLLYPSILESNIIGNDDNDIHNDSNDDAWLLRKHVLRRQLTNQDFLEVLESVCLADLAARVGDGDPEKGLDMVLDWSNTLSLGEQQRLAFGRLLINQPKLVILDEATSALDLASEAKMYHLLQEMSQMSSDITYISVGHRPSLMKFHKKLLKMEGAGNYQVTEIDEKSAISAQVPNL